MGQRIGFTALLIFVKGKVKMVVGFEFTFDALQWCRQIYNLFAYSFDLGEGEVKSEVEMCNACPFNLFYSSLRDSCDIGFRLQFNAEFKSQVRVMDFP